MSLATQNVSASIASAGSLISGSFSKECSDCRQLEIPFAASVTNDETDVTIPYASIEAITLQAFFSSDVSGSATSNVTVKTNSSSVPDQTFTCKPNKYGQWNSDSPFANPISANITKLFVTNPNAVAGTLKITLGANPV